MYTELAVTSVCSKTPSFHCVGYTDSSFISMLVYF